MNFSITKFDRYRENLMVIDENKIVSYTTHVADIDHDNREVKPLGWWSATTSKHINCVAKKLGYKVNP